jgi:hypothetical protein
MPSRQRERIRARRAFQACCAPLFPDGTSGATIAEVRALSLTGVLSEMGEYLEDCAIEPGADALDLTVTWHESDEERGDRWRHVMRSH